MFPTDQTTNVRLDLSVHANTIIDIINQVKEVDPVMAGKLYEEMTRYIKEGTKTATVFSIRELEEYGYLDKAY